MPLPDFTERVQIQPVAASSAGQGLNSLSQRLQNFSNQVLNERLRVLEDQDKPKAIEAGSQPNYQSGSSYTERQRAFNKIAIQANKFSTEMAVRENILKIKNNILNSANFGVDSPQEFELHVRQFAQDFLPQVPKENRQIAKNLINYYGVTNQQSLLKTAKTLSIQQSTRQFNNALMKFKNDSILASYEGDTISGAALLGQAKQLNNLGVETGLVKESEAKVQNQYADMANVKAMYLGEFQRALNNGNPNEFLEKFSTQDIDLPPAMALGTQIQMLGQKVNHDNAKSNEDDSFAERFNNSLKEAQNGQYQNVVNIIAKTRSLGARGNLLADDMEKKLQDATLLHSVNESLKYATPVQRQQALQVIAQSASDENIDTQKLLQTAQKINNKQLKSLQNDPHSYVMKNPVVYQAYENAKQGIDINPYQVEYNQQVRLGVDPASVKFLSSETASNIVHSIKSSPTVNDQVEELHKLLTINTLNPDGSPKLRYGKYTPYIINQLMQKGLNMPVAAVMNAYADPKSQPYIVDAIRAEDAATVKSGNEFKSEKSANVNLASRLDTTTVKNIRLQVRNTMQPYFQSVSGYNNLDPNIPRQLELHVQNLAMQLTLRGDKDAVKNAYNFYIGNHINLDNSLNGHVVQKPYTLQNDVNFSALFHTLNTNARKQLDKIVVPMEAVRQFATPTSTPKDIRTDYLNAIRINGYLQLKPGGLSYQLVDNNGNPLVYRDEDGQLQRFTASVDDINNLQSPLNQQLIDQEAKQQQFLALQIGDIPRDAINMIKSEAQEIYNKLGPLTPELFVPGFKKTAKAFENELNKIFEFGGRVLAEIDKGEDIDPFDAQLKSQKAAKKTGGKP